MKIVKGLLATAIIASTISCENQKKEISSLQTELDSVSYAIGMSISQNMKQSFSDINKDVLIQGFENGLDSTNMLLKITETQSVIQSYFQKKQQEEMKKMVEKAKVNKEEGEAFLAENKTKEGVKTTESGLQYMILKEGTGAKPTAESKVEVNYHGTLLNGTVFDSTIESGKPASFVLNQVIKGWTEGLQLMKEGAKYKFFIPSYLAYGEQQRSKVIEGNSTLIFEVELLKILKK